MQDISPGMLVFLDSPVATYGFATQKTPDNRIRVKIDHGEMLVVVEQCMFESRIHGQPMLKCLWRGEICWIDKRFLAPVQGSQDVLE
jgi:hypothetical protein